MLWNARVVWPWSQPRSGSGLIQTQRAIQRVTGHGRGTIRRWVAMATELGWAAAVQEPDEALAQTGPWELGSRS